MKIIFESKEWENVAQFVAIIPSLVNGSVLTLTIEQTLQGVFCVTLVTDDSAGISILNGSEKPQTISKTLPSPTKHYIGTRG